MTHSRWFLRVCLAGFMMVPAAVADIVFNGVDPGANSTDPRPNSNAAAAAFDLATGPSTLITFESAPLGSFTNLVVAPGVTINGADVSSNPQTIRNSPFGTPDGLFGYNTTAGGSKFVSLFGGTLTFSFSNPVDAFGGYLSGVQLGGETITFSDGSSQTIPIPNPSSTSGGVEFLGFTDFGKDISAVTINVTNDIVGVDDVRVHGAPAVPEPSAVVLLISVVAGCIVLQRKRLTRA